MSYGTTSGALAALAPAIAIAGVTPGQMADDHHQNSSSSSNTITPTGSTIGGGTSSSGSHKPEKSKRMSAARSLSPFHRHRRNSSWGALRKDPAPESDPEADTDAESEAESRLTPRNNAFDQGDPDDDGESTGDSDDEDGDAADRRAVARARARARGDGDEDDDDDEEEEEEEDFEIDPVLLDNTLFNAGCLDLHGAWQGGNESIGDGGYDHLGLDGNDDELEAPNVVRAEDPVPRAPKRRGSKLIGGEEGHQLVASRPVFERNRCTITLLHGDYEKAAQASKRPKRYIVASDGSEESSYAVEWVIGTVLRDGDETLIVSVVETDTKLDALDAANEDKVARMANQKARQAMAIVLARQATALLQRTRLSVKISCQALHAKNARHMLLDMIDFFEPTMVVVGSRGLGALKGILLGSTSHYLVQKSSVPVMVARKRIKLPGPRRGRTDVVRSVRARHMRLDQAAIEKESNVAEDDPEGEGGAKGVERAEGEGGAQTDKEDDPTATKATAQDTDQSRTTEGENDGSAANATGAVPTAPLTSPLTSTAPAPALPSDESKSAEAKEKEKEKEKEATRVPEVDEEDERGRGRSKTPKKEVNASKSTPGAGSGRSERDKARSGAGGAGGAGSAPEGEAKDQRDEEKEDAVQSWSLAVL